MNPKLVLSLWRERWGKTADGAISLPYLKGKPNAWGYRLAHSGMWSLPAATAIATTTCMVLVVWMFSIQFSLGGQIAFSLVLASFALYIRRYSGTLITLALLGLSVVVSARYLYWRFTSTLGHGFNSDFVLGFGLCVAELHLAMLAVVGYLQKVWPVKRVPIELPHDNSKWPTVDIYIFLTERQDQESVIKHCTSALAMDWPKKKFRVYLLDADPRQDIESKAAAMGVTYFGRPHDCSDVTDQIFWALPRTNGELVAIFDGNRLPEKTFLQMAVGWFVRDHTLGLLRTPQHVLATERVPSNLNLFDLTAPAISCALVRRSMLLEREGSDLLQHKLDAKVTRKWQMNGFDNGYIGFTDNGNSKTAIFRVDHGLTSRRLIVEQRLNETKSMLLFYLPISHWVFLTAPIAYLLAGVHLVQASPELLAAFAVPHFAHGYLAEGRMRGSRRLALWSDVRDTILAGYMLLPTTISVARTAWGRLLTRHSRNENGHQEPFRWKEALPFCTLLILNLSGFVAGASRLLMSEDLPSIDLKLYLFWSICNLMLLAATLAVAEESRQIRVQTRKLTRIHAMLRLPSQHTLACETRNFPATTLSLSLPTPQDLEPGTDVGISFFYEQREFDFSAKVVCGDQGLLRVRIVESEWNRYQTTGAAILSRGQDWPKWLPGKNADQPFPPWISRPVGTALLKLKVIAQRFVKVIRTSQMGRWTEKRKIQT